MKKVNMKYTIGEVQQDKLMEYGLDIKDAFILSYIKEINQLEKIIRKTIDGKSFMWIDYEKLITYLPALKIKAIDSMYRRFKKYEDLGLLEKHLHRTAIHGTYTFFYLNKKFSTLFEITKIDSSEEELNENLKKMGLPNNFTHKITSKKISLKSDEKSGGFGRKVGSWSDEKSVRNTPINILQEKDSSSTEEPKPTTASEETFFKNLKDLLIKNNFKNYNSQTLKNIKSYSKESLEEIKKVIEFMKFKNKAINSKILVAILKDGDHKIVEPMKLKTVTKKEKIAYMLEIAFQDDIDDLCNQIAKSFGWGEYNKLSKTDEKIVNIEVERILCERYNNLKI